jgi:putative peptide zinc metalloprotease protein
MDNTQSSQQQKIYTGELRKDLRMFPGAKDNSENKTWVIFDPVADKYFRISEKEHSIVTFLSANSQLEELQNKIKFTDPEINKKDILSVLSFLNNNSLLKWNYKITENRLQQLRILKAKALPAKLMASYLFFRIPLWNPDDFLSKTTDFVKTVFNKWMLLLLFIISVCGYVGVVVHWNKFTAAIIGTLNYSGLIKYGVTIIILKVFHEFAHAYSAKFAGIRVRSFGIGFIIFFPRFFTDITDSWRVKEKKQRMLLDSAGILIELLIGGIAALIWLNTGPGTVNAISYFVFAVSIINTVLINGNPFIRYDGYYLLMDLVNIDNLQKQGSIEIKLLIRRYLFGIKEKISHAITGWKKYFVIIYGISSFIYRLFLYTAIILIVYFKFTKTVGIVLVCLEVYVLVIKPFSTEVRQIMQKKDKIKNKNFLISTGAFAVIFIILFAPLPWIIKMPCIVDSVESNIIYVNQDGFLDKFLVENYQKVKKGQLLFTQRSPYLKFNNTIQKIRLKIHENELDQQRSRFKIPVSDDIKIQQILNTRNDIKENQRKREQLKVTSPLDGTFVLFDWHLKVGRWLSKGEEIGEVFSQSNVQIFAYVNESYINQIHINDKVKIYLHNDIYPYHGKVQSINPVPSKIWRSSPLLSTSGGPIEVLKRENNYTFLLTEYYYQIIIKPNKKYKELRYSQTGNVEMRKFSSLGFNFMRKILKIIQRELTF